MTENSAATRSHAPDALGRGRLLALWLGLPSIGVLLFALELAVGSVRIDLAQVIAGLLV